MAQADDAPPHHADRRDAAAPGRRRRDAVRHLRPATRSTCATSRDVIGLRRARGLLRRDEHADAARPHAVHLRHLRQRRSRAPEQIAEIDAAGRRGGAPLRHRRRRWRCCRIRTSAASTRRRRGRCARRCADLAQRAPDWRSKARCTATRRCPRTIRDRELPGLAPHGRGQPAGHAERRRRQHRLQPAAR